MTSALARPAGPGTCLHHLVEASARRRPDAVAVRAPGVQLDYRELSRRADVLARRLRQAEVVPDTRVGVFVERSVGAVVALLAVLKAGGCFVPIDRDWPAERAAWLLADSGARHLVTRRSRPGRLTSQPAHVVYLDDLPRPRGTGDDRVAAGPAPANLAYVMYTSGSTGRPNGVMVEHRAICNRLLWMQDAYRLAPEARVLHKASLGFDVSVWEIFWPLLAGATVVLARPGGATSPADLRRLIIDERVTVAHFVPSLLRLFLDEPGVADCRSLEWVMCSGEALDPDLVDRFARHLPAGLENLYGPTEAAIDATRWSCRPRPDRRVPIGTPITNLRAHVLDGSLRPVPVATPGEIYLGGAGLARGYLGRPDLTAQRFVADPFGGPGDRLYRTGDRGRALPDGNLEFLGRLDDQVKIGGVRVEPGEVEAVLRDHPGVADAAVVARTRASGDVQLVAQVLRREGATTAPGELRGYLTRRLPRPLIPALVLVTGLPRTPSGKVDRRAVAAAAREGASSPGRSWRGGQVIARIVAEVLERSRVGPDDNFLDLGGDSLQAVRVAARIQRTLGANLGAADVLATTTLAELVKAAEQTTGRGR